MRRNRLFRTESFRLAVLFGAFFLAAVIALVSALYLITENALERDIRTAVDANISAIQDGYRYKAEHEAIEIIQQRTATPGFSDYYLLQDAQGQTLAGKLKPGKPVLGWASIKANRASGGMPGGKILGRGLLFPGNVYLFVGEDSGRVAATRTEILYTFFGLAALVVAMALGGGILFSAKFLHRIDSIAQTCRAIIAGKLTERVPVRDSQDELDILCATINGMLDRIEALMDSLRQVSSDIAHDMRTPLTHLRQRLEKSREQSRNVDDYAVAVDSAIDDTDEILVIFSALLRISQIEAGSRVAKFSSADVGKAMQHVAEIYGVVAEDAGHTLALEIGTGICIRGDWALLVQLLSNLVENAIHHTGEGACIVLLARKDGADAVLEVRDSGPGVPQEQHEKIFRRFYRLEASRSTPGNGFGLAMVAAIAELHGMSIALLNAEPGLRVVLRAPLVPEGGAIRASPAD